MSYYEIEGTITATITISHIVTVEASDEDEAREQAEYLLTNPGLGDIDSNAVDLNDADWDLDGITRVQKES